MRGVSVKNERSSRTQLQCCGCMCDGYAVRGFQCLFSGMLRALGFLCLEVGKEAFDILTAVLENKSSMMLPTCPARFPVSMVPRGTGCHSPLHSTEISFKVIFRNLRSEMLRLRNLPI